MSLVLVRTGYWDSSGIKSSVQWSGTRRLLRLSGPEYELCRSVPNRSSAEGQVIARLQRWKSPRPVHVTHHISHLRDLGQRKNETGSVNTHSAFASLAALSLVLHCSPSVLLLLPVFDS